MSFPYVQLESCRLQKGVIFGCDKIYVIYMGEFKILLDFNHLTDVTVNTCCFLWCAFLKYLVGITKIRVFVNTTE